jgi:hypothetical protein
VIDSPRLLQDLQKEVAKLHADLRARCDAEPAADATLKAQYGAAQAGRRTALTYKAWREEELTNVAVAWVLACVFIRFLEDNALVETLHLAGPDAAGLGRARDQQIVFFREHAGLSEREYLEHVFTETAKLPGMADLFDRRHNPLWTVGPTGDAARAFIEFWRRTDAESGRPVHDFSDPDWNTRFLGDLYQDLSEAARKRYALLQTPVFIEQFILDRTLTPAIETFGFRAVRMIDPTCGSGHFLLGGFARLFALWNEALPGEVPSVIAQHALDQVFGVDLNPNVVAIARFRMLLAALRVTDVTKLRNAYDFKIHVTSGDSLLHGAKFDKFGQAHYGSRQPSLPGSDDPAFRDELKHHYEVEDVEALHRILGQQYHAVVGNPPYITVKDRAVSELYRARYPSCRGKYSLSVPFMERFFDLAVKGDGTPQQPAGFVGQITSNSFMKREFGKKLIEEYLPRWDLTHVLDTSGAYIPGHGTPTVILFGKNQPPVSGTIRTVLGIAGEPATPEEPALGLVWQAIIKQIDEPGSVSEWMSAGDSPRSNFSKHPWSIGGGGAAELKETIFDAAESALEDFVQTIGIGAVSGEDEAFTAPRIAHLHARLPANLLLNFAEGDVLRDWCITETMSALFPYRATTLEPVIDANAIQFLWANRSSLSQRTWFRKPHESRGLHWWEYAFTSKEKLAGALTIAYGEIATHNHFVLDFGGKVFKQTAPVIKLKPGAKEGDYARLLGVLNSSTACFYLKQICHNKGSTVDEYGARQRTAPFEDFYAFNTTKIASFPLPAHQPSQLPAALVQTSTALQAQSPAATLASWSGPESGELRTRLATARDQATRLRRHLIAWQEELDWQIYEAFGLVEGAEASRPAPVSLPEGGAMDPVAEFGLELGERAFEIVLARRMAAGEVQTTWFERHGSTPLTELPRHWPAAYRELVERRLRRIAEDPAIRLIEQPEYKRRWNTEPWDEQFTRAARDWLLARLEGYFLEGDRVSKPDAESARAARTFAPATRPALTTTNQLAEIAKTDAAFQAVAEQLMGGPGFSVPKLVRELVESASVPALPAQRYKPSGLLKRRDWEHVWELQRREDAIDAAEKVDEPGLPDTERTRRKLAAAARKKAELGDLPVPPKYTSADFRKSVWWSLRGKLDVSKERWTAYPGVERMEDPSPVIAWAGWDYAQQARALAEYYMDAKTVFGFAEEQQRKVLTLLLASLQELQPWLDQWHHEVDPAYGVSPADAIRGFVESESHALGVTREDFERVRTGAA